MKKLFLFLAAILWVAGVCAQTLVSAEYFVDADPGPGQGTAVPVTSSDDYSGSFQISGTYTEGIHSLFLRAKGIHGIWSGPEMRLFYQANNFPTINSILQAEYFFDTDSGPGSGTQLPVATGNTLSFNVVIPQSLHSGIHMLCMRTMSEFKVWSTTQTRLFFVQTQKLSENIVSAEYFIDKDPGIGLGQLIPITQGTNVIGSFAINNPFSSGKHNLYVRVKNEEGNWSLWATESYNVCSVYSPVADFDFFKNKRDVILSNNSTHVTSFEWTFGDGESSTTQVSPQHSYQNASNFNVCLKVNNVCGADTLCKNVAVTGLEGVTPKIASDSAVVFLTITGVNFLPSDVFKLQKGGTVFTSERTTITSSGEAVCRFRWIKPPLGFYNCIMQSTNGNDTLFKALEIQLRNELSMEIVMVGAKNVRINRTSYHVLHFSNPSNETVIMDPVTISAPSEPAVSILQPEYDDPDVPSEVKDLSYNKFYPDPPPPDGGSGPAGKKAFVGEVDIPPGGTANMPISFNSSVASCSEFIIREKDEWVKDYPDGDPNADCTFLPPDFSCLLSILGIIPISGCAAGIVSSSCKINKMMQEKEVNLLDIWGMLGGYLANCTGEAAASASAKLAMALKRADQFSSSVGVALGCQQKYRSHKKHLVHYTTIICTQGSNDPNAIYGPQGKTAENYVNRLAPLTYTITAENLETATAPAATVIISDTLDNQNLDLSTVKVSLLQIGDTIINLDITANHSVKDIHLKSLGSKNFLRYVYDLNEKTGVMTHAFYTFDMLNFNVTDDPLIGFLPPNTTSPKGQMMVMYDVMPVKNIPHLTTIQNQASIVFDSNAPILTNVYINTIDTIKPISSLLAVNSMVQDTIVSLYFRGSDANSLPKDYFVSISDNGGEYLTLQNAYSDSLKVTGEVGHTYSFKIQGRDNANNIEDMPATANATVQLITSVDELPNLQIQNFYPNPVSSILNIDFATMSPQSEIVLFNIFGEKIMQRTFESSNKKINAQVDVSHLPPGIYLLQIKTENGSIVRRIIKQ